MVEGQQTPKERNLIPGRSVVTDHLRGVGVDGCRIDWLERFSRNGNYTRQNSRLFSATDGVARRTTRHQREQAGDRGDLELGAKDGVDFHGVRGRTLGIRESFARLTIEGLMNMGKLSLDALSGQSLTTEVKL